MAKSHARKNIMNNSILSNHRFRGYLITSGWIKSLYEKPIPILCLPWWDNFVECLVCKIELKLLSGCQRWCSDCYIIYIGCRYCSTINIIFGLSDQSQCRTCGKISCIGIKKINDGSIDIDEFFHSIRFNNRNNDYFKNIKRNFNPLDVYRFIKIKYTDQRGMEWIPYTRLENFKKIAQGGFSIIYQATWYDNNDTNRTVAIKCFYNSRNFSKYFLNEVIMFNIISYMFTFI